jgi:DNA-directed RNA polymerase subunit RPC12/RpoP
MVSTAKLPKHILSITRPSAQHEYKCVWCSHPIWAKRKYVRVVWEDDEGTVNSDHVCVDCWAKE